jgi:urease subunit alpha
MFGALGRALQETSVTFVSQMAIDEEIDNRYGVVKHLVAVEGCRTVKKADMVLNSYTPSIEVDPETYEVRADGFLLTCEPADVLPLAQRYFLF